MILIFDLDDTLYCERDYVISGLNAVSHFGYDKFGWDPQISYQYMEDILDSVGRGKIFDYWLSSHGRLTKTNVRECVNVYRHHTPLLRLDPDIELLLKKLSVHSPLYLVTDGHKVVQSKKVTALKLEKYLKKSFITHRYGVRHAKPSIHCFELIKQREECSWEEMVYVGDNPAKDFVNLNPLGVRTIRVRTGIHRDVLASAKFEAQLSIDNVTQLPQALDLW